MIMRKNKGFVSKKLFYPIILILQNGISITILKENILTTVYKKSFDQKEMLNAVIYDSTGSVYRVVDVFNCGATNFLWGLDIWGGRKVFIGLEVEEVEKLSLEKFKKVAKKIAKANSDYYASAGTKLTDVISQIEKAVDIGEINSIILP